MKTWMYAAALVIGVVLRVHGAPATEEKERVRRDDPVASYLDAFGYRNEGSDRLAALMSEDPTVMALKDFQRMAHIPVTGKADAATINMMEMDRCGNKDRAKNYNGESGKRKRRYLLEGSRWPTNQAITYAYQEYTPDLSPSVVEKEVDRAFLVWSDNSGLTFQKINDIRYADIVIRFVRRNHGDGNSFDGPGNILAHAFFPRYGGDAHFDEDELWTFDSFSGKNLFQVAAHEIGHSLGLEHSEVRDALMAPFYRGYQPNFRLDNDDIQGIQRLYGPRVATARPPGPTDLPPAPTMTTPRATQTTTTRSTSTPDRCRDGRVDAVTNYKNGKTYVFRGSLYYKIGDNGVEETNVISQRLPGVSNNLEAALYWPSGYDTSRSDREKLFLFKGSQMWVISNNQFVYPGAVSISTLFPGLPSNLDAAFVWGGNDRTYFVKGSQYYRVPKRADSRGQYPVDSGYPKPLSVWGFSSLSEAFQHENGRTYFFIDKNYYRFNDYSFSVDNAYPPYPRPNDLWWYGCTDSSSIKENSMNEEVDAMDHDQMETVTTHAGLVGDSSSASQVSSPVLLIPLLLSSLLFYFH